MVGWLLVGSAVWTESHAVSAEALEVGKLELF